MDSNEPLEEFKPRAAGRVFSFQKNWHDLFDLLPRLHNSAIVFRGKGAIHCWPSRFPSMQRIANSAFHSDGYRGISLNLEKWHEAWWYHEERFGKLLPCLEIADENGQGIFKLCYRDDEFTLEDFAQLKHLILNEEDAWSILHLQRSNLMDCQSHRKKPNSMIHKALLAIQKEANEKNARLGLLVPSSRQSTWDNLPPMQQRPSCCWLSFGSDETYLNIRPSSYRRVEVTGCGSRKIALFYDEEDEVTLSIVEPEGLDMQSFRQLSHSLFS